MTGETPNPLDVLRDMPDWFTSAEDKAEFAAALAQVEALAEAAQAVVRNGARMPASDPPIVPDEISDLRAALAPFAAHENTDP